MIDQKIEKAAQEYAQRLVNEYDQDLPELSLCDLKFDCQNAFIAGAQVALQNQWVSVEERLPEDDSYFSLVADARLDPLGVDCAEYTCETKLFSRGGKILHPTHWCVIPKLNPEKDK